VALFNRVTNWVSNQVLTASALNGEFNNILNNAQLSSWVGFSANVAQMKDQTSPGTLGSESLAASGSDELQRLRYILAQVIGSTYWYDISGQVSTLQAGGVPTGGLAANAVTPGKLATLNKVISSSCDVYGVTNSYAQITNMSINITVSGARPIMLALQADTSTNAATFAVGQDQTMSIEFYNVTTSAVIGTFGFSTTTGSGAIAFPGGYQMLVPTILGAGTYNIIARAVSTSNSSSSVEYMTLAAWEVA
jgi:hypothetical protein